MPHYLEELCERLQAHETRPGKPADSFVLCHELLDAMHTQRNLVPTVPRVLRMFALFLHRGAFNLSVAVRSLNALAFTRNQLAEVPSLVHEVQKVHTELPHSALRLAFGDLGMKWRSILDDTPSVSRPVSTRTRSPRSPRSPRRSRS